jgi:hypothetical protein
VLPVHLTTDSLLGILCLRHSRSTGRFGDGAVRLVVVLVPVHVLMGQLFLPLALLAAIARTQRVVHAGPLAAGSWRPRSGCSPLCPYHPWMVVPVLVIPEPVVPVLLAAAFLLFVLLFLALS